MFTLFSSNERSVHLFFFFYTANLWTFRRDRGSSFLSLRDRGGTFGCEGHHVRARGSWG